MRLRPRRIVRRLSWAHGAALLCVACWVLALPAAALGQTAASGYRELLAREKAARTPSAPASTLRSLATKYEQLAGRHPGSGYADNALWQAAGLLELAFERAGRMADRDGAIRLLQAVKRAYPTSSLAPDVDARIASLKGKASSAARPAAAAARPATTPKAEAPPVTPVAPAGPATTALKDITTQPLPRGTRFILEFAREVAYSTARLESPDRFEVTVAAAQGSSALSAKAATLGGALARAPRLSSPSAGRLVLTLPLLGPSRVSAFPLYDPYRVVIDLESDGVSASSASRPPAINAPAPTAPAKVPTPPTAAVTTSRATTVPPAAPAKPEPPSNTEGGRYSLARQLGLDIARVVIDPGHGGHDPGAQANGVTEAELVLDIATRLETLLLRQTGFEVVLTRRDDRFVPLGQRTAIANRESADLFLSIHANSSPQTETRGVETYVLNFSSTPGAEAVAARENAAADQHMGALPELVKAITLNNKLAESREFASLVQTSLVRRLKAQQPAIRDLGVKQAPFAVLIGAQMPSVLAEVSFLTNRAEALQLRQPGYRQRIAQALADAILSYRASLKAGSRVASRQTK